MVELETMPEFYYSLADFSKKLKDAGITIIGKVASVEGAVEFEKAGVDFISVKGADGGGHIYGFTGTFSLIPQVVDAVNVTVINSIINSIIAALHSYIKERLVFLSCES